MHGMHEREERRRGGEAHEEKREHREEREHRAEGGKTLETKMVMDHPDDKDGGREHHRRPRRARGGEAGKPKVHLYNAVGPPEAEEIEEDEDGFSRGGRKHRRHGGEAKGEHSEERADKHPRGRRAAGGAALKLRHGGEAHEREHRAKGGSVYSEASKISMKHGDEASRGHEGQKVPPEPGPS